MIGTSESRAGPSHNTRARQGGILFGFAGMILFVPVVGIAKLIVDQKPKWKTPSMILGMKARIVDLNTRVRPEHITNDSEILGDLAENLNHNLVTT
jgi:hypothetical protein